ncbi:hypothetical protein TPA0907_41890 [Micromonospora humidisoli]|nr:hypothetical protein TPA0907_41890 [Micromonospora sp. AKA109]
MISAGVRRSLGRTNPRVPRGPFAVRRGRGGGRHPGVISVLKGRRSGGAGMIGYRHGAAEKPFGSQGSPPAVPVYGFPQAHEVQSSPRRSSRP